MSYINFSSENKEHGFFKEMEYAGIGASEAFNAASKAIAMATETDGLSAARFLDSQHGRHFADDVLNAMSTSPIDDAIKTAVQRWMDWTIGEETSEDYGIPQGLPYLTGFVINANLEN
jgi:hypothetical protein